MFKRPVLALLVGALSCGLASAQAKKIYAPAGKTLDNALKKLLLVQPGAQSFHVLLKIAQTKGEVGAYAATVEETWLSNTRWRRTVSAENLVQTTVMNGSGLHYATSGDYFPLWLRSFVTALLTPVPNAEEWNRSKEPLEHMELGGGVHSDSCLHGEAVIGIAPAQQVNFSNVCFRPDGLLDYVSAPDYGMEFHDYGNFGKLRVARTLIDNPVHGVQVTGKVATLELAPTSDSTSFETPEGSVAKDPLASVSVRQDQLERLAGGPVSLQWPDPIPGHGMFTVWVSVDRTGQVREVHNLNSDESGLAAAMAAQLVGRKWKGAVVDGQRVQVQGGMTFAYPSQAAGVVGEPPVTLTEKETVPMVIHPVVPPVYPDIAKRSNISGTVVMHALIGVDGKVKQLQVSKSDSELLSQPALDAAKQWRYRPYLSDGRPREVDTTITIRFQM